MISPIAHIVVGVADMAPVRNLWQAHFGLVEQASRIGPDPDLSRCWDIADDAIAEQLLLSTPGARAGWLHFVRFNKPDAPVRQGADTTDLCPKNLDVNCTDMAARCEMLAADGYVFRSAINEYDIGGLSAREVQFGGHDDTNIVLIELDDWPVKLSSRHYGAVSSLVVVVADTAVEADFYCRLFGHEQLMHHRIAGKAIEDTVGLPPGSALDMRLTGDPEEFYGRVELIAYEGTSGTDRFSLARPPALGTLLCRFEVDDPHVLLQQAKLNGYAVNDRGVVDCLYGRCRLMTIKTPAGFSVEAFSREE